MFKQPRRARGALLKVCILDTNASCVIEKPMKLLDDAKKAELPEDVEVEVGSLLHGERIVAEAEKHGEMGKTRGSSTHNIQTCTFEKNVLCVLSRAMIGLHLC